MRVQIHELRVQIHELRVQIHELQIRIPELRVQIHEIRVQIHELPVQISTSSRIIKSMKTQVNGLQIFTRDKKKRSDVINFEKQRNFKQVFV